ncbi:hypothetical protein ACC686_36560, partial [Rhizobium johnstonii]|uniref:hypothetical protein n=1 Tax=Rhizobium johnstonii TaxID=3019933 RepID=UPI003F9599B7
LTNGVLYHLATAAGPGPVRAGWLNRENGGLLPQLFGGTVAAQFRLRFDRLFAALLAGFGLFIHATGLAEFEPIQKALCLN